MGKILVGVVFAFAIAGLVSFVMTDLGADPRLKLGAVLGTGLGTLMNTLAVAARIVMRGDAAAIHSGARRAEARSCRHQFSSKHMTM